MKRDLKINYGILDDIINQLGIYKRSLRDMESSLSTIATYIEQNRGESIEEWKDKMKGSKEQMAEYETQINDLLHLFQGYVDDTTAYITPLQRNAMMRVDRNDIYWNLKQMDSGIHNNVRNAIQQTNKSPSNWGFWEDVTDTEKEASSINKYRISSIRSDIEQTNSRLNHKMDQLWDIYNSKVKKYENMDDEYNDKAAALKKKYTNFFEGFWDLAEGTGEFVADLVVGLLKGLFIDIGWGLIKLVYNAGIIAVSAKIPDIIEPKFLKDAANERIDSFYTMVQQIVEDPFSVVEGMGQSISDSVEEDGIVYVTGGVAAGFVPIVGWSKYAKIGKVIDTDKPKKSVDKIDNNEGEMVDPVELLLVNGKKVGIEFTNSVTGQMKNLMEILEVQHRKAAVDGGPGSVNRIPIDSEDTMRRAEVEKVEGKGTGNTSSKVNNIKEINEVNYGDHFTKGKRGRKELAPNVRYVTQDGYKYTTDELGRIVDVEADNLILQEADRNLGMQRAAGREDRLPDDDGGHLIGSQFHGSGDIDNLVAQNSQINRSGGQWYKMETEWANALKETPPRKVFVKIEPIYIGKSLRPDSFEIMYEIEGKGIFEKIIKNKSGG